MSETTQNARRLRQTMTDAEKKLWRHLRGRQVFGHKFRRQAHIGRYIADFVCFDQKLIVEVDGGQHKDQAAYDTARSRWLRTQGFRVVRFWNSDVLNNIEGVLERIGGLVGGGTSAALPPSPPPRPSPIKGEGE
jgi:very-short-patch-repair endonuclease